VAIRVLLVDDHALFRDGLRALFAAIGGQPALEIAAEAGSAREAYVIADRRVPVDVVVLDISLPGPDGLALLRELKRRGLEAPVLMLTMFEQPYLIASAFAAGARGYARKSDGAAQLVQAVRALAKGERWLPPSLAGQSLEHETRPDPLAALSAREREIFGLLVRGHSSPDLARELGISVKTAEAHRTHIFRKLRVRGIVELVRFAAHHDLLDPIIAKQSA
jgi:DNA-binding NarL/FixJ family response regulator